MTPDCAQDRESPDYAVPDIPTQEAAHEGRDRAFAGKENDSSGEDALNSGTTREIRPGVPYC